MAVRRSDWLFPRSLLADSPSSRDGVTEREEYEIRRKTCMFVEKCAMRFKPAMPKLTIATAQVFFHRFFSRQSFKAHERLLIAMACLHLAGKVEEAPRKLSMVAQVYHVTRNKGARPLDQKGEEFQKLKEQILIAERVLLHTIAFDLDIDHPHPHIVQLVTRVRVSDKAKNKELVQSAWHFVNDSLRTNLCLQHEPRDIACAAVYLAGKVIDFPQGGDATADGAAATASAAVGAGDAAAQGAVPCRWAGLFGIETSKLYDICTQILELYERQPSMAGVGASVARLTPGGDGGVGEHEHRDKRRRLDRESGNA